MTVQITVAMNLTDPLAWLGFAPTCTLAAEAGVELRWRPLRTRPVSDRQRPGPEADRSSWHLYHRVQNRDVDLRRYAAVQGLALGDLHRDVDAYASTAALLWLAERHPESTVRQWLGEVLGGYWNDGLAIDDLAVVAATLPTADRDSFTAWVAGAGQEVERAEQELRAAGLQGVPGYLIDGEPFVGRAHLPMLRWIVGERRGPAPI